MLKFIAVSRKIANHVMNLIFLWDWNGRSWMVYAIDSMEMQRENNSYFLSYLYSDFMSQLNQVIKVEIYINYVRKLQKSERMWFEKYFLKIFIISRLDYQIKGFFIDTSASKKLGNQPLFQSPNTRNSIKKPMWQTKPNLNSINVSRNVPRNVHGIPEIYQP